MGGFFGAFSHRDVGLDVFFGTDYHSHLGTRRGGMVVYGARTDSSARFMILKTPPSALSSKATCASLRGILAWAA